MASLPEYGAVSNPWTCGFLGKKTRRSHNITLVLDLDETLIHSNYEKVADYDFKINILDLGKDQDVYVSLRPYVKEFLTEISKHFELVLFTAAEVLTNSVNFI